jgi:hypothetical protein
LEFTAEREHAWTRGHFILFVRPLCGITAFDEYAAIAGWRSEVRRYKSKVNYARLKKQKAGGRYKFKNKGRTAEIFVVVSRVLSAFLQERSVERAGQELAGCFLFHFTF